MTTRLEHLAQDVRAEPTVITGRRALENPREIAADRQQLARQGQRREQQPQAESNHQQSAQKP
ncbi:hypothetical protein D3C84_983690 [compost metagenome]